MFTSFNFLIRVAVCISDRASVIHNSSEKLYILGIHTQCVENILKIRWVIYIYIDLNFSSIFYKNIEDFFVKTAAEKKWRLVEEANRKKSKAKELELKIKETEESLQRQKKRLKLL